MKAKQLALSVSHEAGEAQGCQPARLPLAPAANNLCLQPLNIPQGDTPSSVSRKCWKSAAIAGFHFMLFTFSYFALRAPQTILLLVVVVPFVILYLLEYPLIYCAVSYAMVREKRR